MAEKALRELLSAKADVEYGIALVTAATAERLVRRARTLLELAIQIVTSDWGDSDASLPVTSRSGDPAPMMDLTERLGIHTH